MTATISTSTPDARRRARDPRLDVFRGLGMFIILIAHIPGNAAASWIPARFGFSDATEIFVFCSGIASAYAFGTIFDRHGWLWGARRIASRVWQVYWAHVGVFVVVLGALGFVDHQLGTRYLRDGLNLAPFLDAPGDYVYRFLSLTYVPNYFDILPMYLVILAMIPAAMALARISPMLLAAASLVLWAVAQTHALDLSAEPWSERPWFFNPFAWQLVFFTGFAFARGWLPAPPRSRNLVALSVVVLVVSAPFSCHYGFSCYAGWGRAPALGAAHEVLSPLIDKPHFGAFRYLHFLAIAYLAFVLAGERGRALQGRMADALMQVGQQTLAVFLTGLVIAQLLGVLIDQWPVPGVQVVANVGGCALLMLAARLVSLAKAHPPRHPAEPRKAETPAQDTLHEVLAH